MGPEAASARGRDVVDRGPAGLFRLAGARPLLVDGPRRDLLGLVLRGSAVEQAVLDVLVLTVAFRRPRWLRHRSDPPSVRPDRARTRETGSTTVGRQGLAASCRFDPSRWSRSCPTGGRATAR